MNLNNSVPRLAFKFLVNLIIKRNFHQAKTMAQYQSKDKQTFPPGKRKPVAHHCVTISWREKRRSRQSHNQASFSPGLNVEDFN